MKLKSCSMMIMVAYFTRHVSSVFLKAVQVYSWVPCHGSFYSPPINETSFTLYVYAYAWRAECAAGMCLCGIYCTLYIPHSYMATVLGYLKPLWLTSYRDRNRVVAGHKRGFKKSCYECKERTGHSRVTEESDWHLRKRYKANWWKWPIDTNTNDDEQKDSAVGFFFPPSFCCFFSFLFLFFFFSFVTYPY